MDDLIKKLKKMDAARFEKFVVDNPVIVQGGSPEEQEFIAAKWATACEGKPFPYGPQVEPEPTPAPVATDEQVKAALDDIATPPHYQTVPLTRAEQRLKELIDASTDMPDVVEVNDLAPYQDPLAVPDGLRIKRFSYRWVSNANMSTALAIFGGMWRPVNRTNHPNADTRMFDATGGLRFRGQVVLCCCRRETMEGREKRIANEFAFKTKKSIDELSRNYQTPEGKTVVTTEIVDDPGAMPGMDLTTDEEYDYGSPLS